MTMTHAHSRLHHHDDHDADLHLNLSKNATRYMGCLLFSTLVSNTKTAELQDLNKFKLRLRKEIAKDGKRFFKQFGTLYGLETYGMDAFIEWLKTQKDIKKAMVEKA